jgi:hypothetical protein
MSHLHTLTLMEDPPVLIGTPQKGFSIAEDWAPGEAEMRQILDAREEPLFYISDIRVMKLTLDDLIAGANLGSRGQAPIWQHPKIRGVYLISDLKMVELAARGLNSPIFGNMKVRVYKTVEAALEDIKHILAS